MKSLMMAVFAAALIVMHTAGCAIVESPQAQIVADTLQQVFDQALTTAVSVLTSQGTQQLAIAAAQSYVASQIPDAGAQQVCNKIISQAVPTLAQGIGKLASVRGSTLQARAAAKKNLYIGTPQYKALVQKCVQQYRAQVR